MRHLKNKVFNQLSRSAATCAYRRAVLKHPPWLS
jgi:hypothetical protein